jgi:hypothetical protein
MSSKRDIQTAVQKLAGTYNHDFVYVKSGIVKSVNKNIAIVTVANDTEVPINLQSSVCDGLLIVPAVGSTVYFIDTVQGNPFIVLYGDVDSYYLQVGNSSVNIDNGGNIQFNDGTFKGLVKVQDLVAKLNKIENDINALKTSFSGWTPVPNDGGAALKTAAATWYSTALTPTQQIDIENTKVTHGQ